jgi:hypothetical protein
MSLTMIAMCWNQRSWPDGLGLGSQHGHQRATRGHVGRGARGGDMIGVEPLADQQDDAFAHDRESQAQHELERAADEDRPEKPRA